VTIDKTEQMLKEDRTVSLKEMSESLNVSPERIHHTVMVESGASQLHASYVRHDLSDE
jgi:DeoR/GlpR family transcriptional regulator of sugar metabolism